MALHDAKELDDDLRRGPDEDLTLAAALSVDNIVLRVGSMTALVALVIFTHETVVLF